MGVPLCHINSHTHFIRGCYGVARAPLCPELCRDNEKGRNEEVRKERGGIGGKWGGTASNT